MMSTNVRSPEEEKGADMDGAKRDEAEWEGGAAASNYLDQN